VKTGRTESLGVQYAAGQQREPPFAARRRALRGRWFMVRPLVVVAATVFLAACTPLGGSPGASPTPQAPTPLVSAGPAAGPVATAEGCRTAHAADARTGAVFVALADRGGSAVACVPGSPRRRPGRGL